MKALTNIVGIALIILGIIFLAYRGITYNKQEEVARLGDLKITATTEKTIPFSPILGGAVILVGVILVVVARLGKK